MGFTENCEDSDKRLAWSLGTLATKDTDRCESNAELDVVTEGLGGNYKTIKLKV